MVISLVLLFLWGFGITLTLWGTRFALKRLRPVTRQAIAAHKKPITLLKPLKGADAGLEENLLSYFRLEYPVFEILFSVANSNDPAVAIVKSLQARFPAVDTKLVVGDRQVGPNPKINNLMRSYEMAKYEWCLISDSNTRVESDYLYQLLPHLRESTGVVSAVVVGESAASMGGEMECAYLNTFFARWTFIALFFRKPFVIGKSMCFRKSTAERFGGLARLGQFIAEDNMFGQAVLRLGLKIRIMSVPVRQHVGVYSFGSFWSRHIRWGRIRKSQAPIAFLAEPLTTCFFSGLLGAVGFHRITGGGGLAFFALHVVVWLASDLLMMSGLKTTMTAKPIFAWFLRECLAMPQWLHTALGNTVVWRGRRLKILSGGIVIDPGNSKGTQDAVVSVGCGHQQPSDRGRKPLQRLVGLGGRGEDRGQGNLGPRHRSLEPFQRGSAPRRFARPQ